MSSSQIAYIGHGVIASGVKVGNDQPYKDLLKLYHFIEHSDEKACRMSDSHAKDRVYESSARQTDAIAKRSTTGVNVKGSRRWP